MRSNKKINFRKMRFFWCYSHCLMRPTFVCSNPMLHEFWIFWKLKIYSKSSMFFCFRTGARMALKNAQNTDTVFFFVFSLFCLIDLVCLPWKKVSSFVSLQTVASTSLKFFCLSTDDCLSVQKRKSVHYLYFIWKWSLFSVRSK